MTATDTKPESSSGIDELRKAAMMIAVERNQLENKIADVHSTLTKVLAYLKRGRQQSAIGALMELRARIGIKEDNALAIVIEELRKEGSL